MAHQGCNKNKSKISEVGKKKRRELRVGNKSMPPHTALLTGRGDEWRNSKRLIVWSVILSDAFFHSRAVINNQSQFQENTYNSYKTRKTIASVLGMDSLSLLKAGCKIKIGILPFFFQEVLFLSFSFTLALSHSLSRKN